MLNTTAYTRLTARHTTLVSAAALLTIATLVLTGCSASGLPLPADASPPGPASGRDTAAGCPTPVPFDDLGLEENGSSAGQSIQDAATQDDDNAVEQGTIPALAAREALLDRVNQGPLRPDVRAEAESAAPDPGLELHADNAVLSSTLLVSDSAGQETPDATPTPCP